MDANGFFRNLNGQGKSGYRYNQFGFTAGGPLTPSRERLFFFLNYEGLRVRSAGGGYYTVPTAKMHTGDFSDLLNPALNNKIVTQIYDPATIDASGQRLPFAGNIIPAARQSPIALKMLASYPVPVIPGTFNNYFTPAGGQNAINTFSTKLDYRVSNSDNLFGRFSWSNQNSVAPDAFGTPGSPTIGFQGLRDRSVTLDNSLTKWGWILHGNAGIAYNANPADTPDYKGVTGILGLPSYLNAVIQREIFPLVQPSGYSQLGQNTAFIIGNKFYNVIFSGDASKLVGSHTIKFGGQYRLNRLSSFRPQKPGRELHVRSRMDDAELQWGPGRRFNGVDAARAAERRPGPQPFRHCPSRYRTAACSSRTIGASINA